MRIKAFTLAEILITLLIIGVVASFVIPNLINDVKDEQYKVAWKKVYAEISQVTARVLLDNGGTFIGLCTDWDHNCLANEYAQYLNFTKFCPSGSVLGTCWFNNDQSSKFLNGTGITSWGNSTGFILSNGAFVKLDYFSSQCTNAGWGSPDCGGINIDVNGFNKPNVVGKDIFYIHIKPNRLVPRGTDDGNSCSGNGLGCASYMLVN
jgi:prepilin-type N-terminal cleavage/methylation domain-containing protein